MRLAALAFAVALLALPGAASEEQPRPAAALLQELNAARAKAGLAALAPDPVLTGAAEAHAADMARRGYFAHTAPDGETFAARIAKTGYAFAAIAENLALGSPEAAVVVGTQWANSAEHRANMLNPEVTAVGVGYDPGSVTVGGETLANLWVAIFALPLR